jgi:aldehyde:ferredoxin oxidoreductase
MYLRNGKIGIFDLSAGEQSEQEFSDELAKDGVSSIRIAEKLASEHGEDSLVLGTGLLTASFVPASCAGILWSRRGLVPILGHAGFELKMTGFDFIVIKGRAERRGYLWIRDGMMELVESSGFESMDSWKRTDKIRSDQGDGKIQVLSIGPWGDSGKQAAQLVLDYWGGEDKVGMGSELGKRNISAIAFRGMGEIELAEPEKHFEDSLLLIRDHVLRLGKNEGLVSYWKGADRDDFKKLLHRPVACYGCPYPCRSYLKVFEDPKEMRMVENEPGYLHYDIPALEKCFAYGLGASDATIALMKCARAGVEPASLLDGLLASGSKVSVKQVESAAAKPSDIKNARAMNFESSFSDIEQYRNTLGLGVCPRYWSKIGFDLEALVSYGQSAYGRPIEPS